MRLGARYGLDARRRALRRCAPRRVRDAEAPSRARPRPGDLGPLHRADHRRAWAATGDTYAAAVEMTANWEHAHHFELYDDARPALDESCVRAGSRSACSRTPSATSSCSSRITTSTSTRCSRRACTGRRSRTRRSSVRMLELLDVDAADAVMVGDTIEDDVEGARAVGMRAILVDREGLYPDAAERLDDLSALSAALGLTDLVYAARRELAHLGAPRGGTGGRRAADARTLLPRARRARRRRRRRLRPLLGAGTVGSLLVFIGGSLAVARRSCGRSRAGMSACRRSHAPAPTRSSAARRSSRGGSTCTAGACASAARSGARGRTSTTRCSSKGRLSTSSRSRGRPLSSPNRRVCTWLP